MISYHRIISLENLFLAWSEFIRGKKYKKDVQDFALHLSANIYSLYCELSNRTYCHGGYRAFKINDPKPRNIHKASVRDRLLRHAIHRSLYGFFHQRFIYDSYSCRVSKGTHRALDRLKVLARRASQNHRRTCWILKCDIRRFFDSIDHRILLQILSRHISDAGILNLLERVISSFHSARPGVGLPLGNLTSQLLVNVYLNEFDQFIKHDLKAKYYIRYADDFVILSPNKASLENLLPKLATFLYDKLKLELHPNKVSLTAIAPGVDFLGWVHFPDHRVLRTSTKKRMFKKLQKPVESAVLESHLGLLRHGNTYKLQQQIKQWITGG